MITMSNYLPTPEISTEEFTWNKETRTFSTEASDLVRCNFDVGQAYADACDVGFTIVSKKTGVGVKLVNTHTEMRDGDLLWEEFQPINPKQKGLFNKVIIFND